MTLSEVKKQLSTLNQLTFTLPDGSLVPSHFHVTEVGKTSKHFIDCGGTLRQEKKINFQLWSANDYDHRLHPEKLIKIIELSEDILNLGDLDIEVEYQGDLTIQKFGLEYKNNTFQLTSLLTDCLAKDNCGVPTQQSNKIESCAPGSGCC
ncbi:DUF6428 family protein [Olleya sp. YS]|uniref:DUF6428 family protein n=1 Tax=Olleya sp. YS TaxID=3028318 RepID=UPI0024345972|nr:DUF6428 family protein [Olleya sp. YS]WGD34827.1 DUF6428 family protein [Olleya sp. YS]